MKCHRCGSAMVYERFYGPHEQFLGWRCILCGEIVDQVILENRREGAGGENTSKIPLTGCLISITEKEMLTFRS